MKIVHVSHRPGGGAGRAAFRLVEALAAAGQDVTFVSLTAEPKDSPLYKAWPEGFKRSSIGRDINRLHKHYVLDNRTPLSNTYFSLTHPSARLLNNKWIREADIVHFHWIAGCVAPGELYQLARAGKKLFWTLHDEWAYTGGCHYTAGCRRYESICSSCPQLLSDPLQIATKTQAEKAKTWENLPLTVVGPSQWIVDCARKSTVFKNHEVEKIPYSLDLDVFRPLPKTETKRRLGINPQKKWLLFGADNSLEHRKGSNLLVDALLRMKDLKENIGVMALGYDPKFLHLLPFESRALGFVKSDFQIAEVYAAADILALPSLEDNLPNLMLESLACGTPVVALDVGGMRDHLRGQVGKLASYEADPVSSFEAALRELLREVETRPHFSEECRRYAEENFHPALQAQRYLALYQRAARTASVAKQEPLNDHSFFAALLGGRRNAWVRRCSFFFSKTIPEDWAKLLDVIDKTTIKIKKHLGIGETVVADRDIS